MSDVLPLIALGTSVLGLAGTAWCFVVLRRLKRQMRAAFARQRIGLHPDMDKLLTRSRGVDGLSAITGSIGTMKAGTMRSPK